jgi:hypothetical protein
MSLLLDDISRVIASPISRRKAIGMVGATIGGALLAAIGFKPVALGQETDFKCPKGTTPCHGKCCPEGLICCGGKCCTSRKAKCLTSFCCESGIVCAGKCCKDGEFCVKGKCRKQISPTEP